MLNDLLDEHGNYKLMGYCEQDEEWWKFATKDTFNLDKQKCPNCGRVPSQQIGFQVISQRTYDPIRNGKKKLKKRLR